MTSIHDTRIDELGRNNLFPLVCREGAVWHYSQIHAFKRLGSHPAAADDSKRCEGNGNFDSAIGHSTWRLEDWETRQFHHERVTCWNTQQLASAVQVDCLNSQ